MTMCSHCGQEDCDAGYLCPRSGARRDRAQPTPEYDKSELAACGEGSFISGRIELRRPHLARIGKHTNVDSGLYCTTALDLGDYVHLAAQCSVIGGAEGLFKMGHFSTLGAGSRIVTASDARTDGDGLVGPGIPPAEHARVDVKPVIFEPLVIGTTAIVVLPGVTLGMGCFVAAGAVVIRDCEPWTVYAGVPAKAIGVRPKAHILDACKRLGYEALVDYDRR
jgi:acetyltransferase-like isoleucine patch superfamily enzyme